MQVARGWLRGASRVVMVAAIGATAGCSTMMWQVDESVAQRPLTPEHERGAGPRVAPRTYVYSQASGPAKRRLNLNQPSVRLIDALRAVYGQGIRVIPEDPGVDLRRTVSVYLVQGSPEDARRILIARSGYDITVVDNEVRVASVARRKWVLPSLASSSTMSGHVGGDDSSGSGDSGSTSTSSASSGSIDSTLSTSTTSIGGGAGSTANKQRVEMSSTTDVWEDLVDNIKAILGADESAAALDTGSTPPPTDATGSSLFPFEVPPAGSSGQGGSAAPPSASTSAALSARDEAYVRPAVMAVRSTGVIYAIGNPVRMAMVDDLIRDLEYDSHRQVHLAVRAYEVSLSDERAHGIDWSLLTRAIGTVANSAIDVTVSGSSTPDVQGAGAFALAVTGTSQKDGRETVNAVFNFLSRYGQVELISEPDLTTTAGHPAFISSGEEISFVASVSQSADSQGRLTVTPLLQRIAIGVTLTIVPRVTRDDRIALDIIPVISSLSGFTDIEVGGQRFSTPNIPLKELATHVVVRPGETVHLGGIITSRLAKTMSRLPLFRERNITDLVLASENNGVERREFVMTVTPDLVGG